nr:AMP-binding protein [Chloroflexota bacterium]
LFETSLTRAYVDQNVRAGWWPNTLLTDDLDAAARKDPGRTAIIDSRGTYTYGELRVACDHVSLGLLELGVRHGDVVTVQLPNWNEFVVMVLALERIGAVINPIAPTFREREVAGMMRLARPVAAVVPHRFRDFDYPAMYARMRAQTPSLKAVVVVDGERGEGDLSWAELIEAGRRDDRRRDVLTWLRPGPDDVSELIFTSGTTGEPKGVLHTPNTLASAALGAIRSQELGADDVFHMASTFAHQTGFIYGIRLPIHLGATGIWQDVWDASRFIELVEQHGITFTMGATPFVMDTLRGLGPDGSPLRTLRTFISAGAPIAVPMAEEVRQRLTTRLAPGWGMTENGLGSVCMAGDPPEKTTTSDGRPHPGMELQVRRADGGAPGPGTEGDLFVRGPFTFVGYVQGRAFTERFFDREGWFETGDRALIDDQGFVRITGRTKDIIIRGGDNIPVKEIEDLILRHPAVAQVAVVAVPDERLGERAAAYVVLKPSQTLDLTVLQQYMREHAVTTQFWPERLRIIDEMPTTPSGKVQKYRLRELAKES